MEITTQNRIEKQMNILLASVLRCKEGSGGKSTSEISNMSWLQLRLPCVPCVFLCSAFLCLFACGVSHPNSAFAAFFLLPALYQGLL